MSNLDEYQIERMLKNKAPVNYFIAGTEIVNVTDNPKLECVYKMAELIHADGSIEYKAKLAKGKESYPGKKQVFRVYKDEKMVGDIIGLEDEKLGEPLLQKFIERGNLISNTPDLEEIKIHLEKELKALPDEYKNINKSVKYPVSISQRLEALLEDVKKKHG
jgi:nicotinate phosphoribosyltransferase